MSTLSREPHFWLNQHKFPWHKCSATFPPWKEQSVSLSSFLAESSEKVLVKNTLLGHLVHKLIHIITLPVAYSPHMLPEFVWLQLEILPCPQGLFYNLTFLTVCICWGLLTVFVISHHDSLPCSPDTFTRIYISSLFSAR